MSLPDDAGAGLRVFHLLLHYLSAVYPHLRMGGFCGEVFEPWGQPC
jgi:hypothetical protein